MSEPQIVTFYSYKGGTGRSMALANVAWILAANGYRVLAIDWDLEAPGLHRYFHPFLEDKELTETEGLIDFVMRYAGEAILPQETEDWYRPCANILKYAESLNYTFPNKGTLDFVCAGRQGADYSTRVNSFNWRHFYDKLNGGMFFEAVKASFQGYHYVLIDSRTGVSDTSGICTVQMPHALVVCYTLNRQSVEGALAVAQSADAQRRGPAGERMLRIFPVPTRVELAEQKKLALARRASRDRFDSLLWHVEGNREDEYWAKIEVLYQPYYAYEEVLASFGDQPGQAHSILAAMESLAGLVSGAKGPLRMPPIDPAERTDVLARYSREPAPEAPSAVPPEQAAPVPKEVASPPSPAPGNGGARYWVYFSYAWSDRNEYLLQFVRDVSEELRRVLGISRTEPVVFYDEAQAGEAAPGALERAIASSRTVVCLASQAYFNSVHCGKEFSVFLQRYSGPGCGLVPVNWEPARSVPPSFMTLELARGAEGVLQWLRLARYRKKYHQYVSELAHSLAVLGDQRPLPVLPDAPSLDDVPNAFAQDSPPGRANLNSVVFAFLAATRSEVSPYADMYGDSASHWSPFGKPIIVTAGEVAARNGLGAREKPITADNVPALIRETEEQNRVLAIVLDIGSLSLIRCAEVWQSISKARSGQCFLIMIGLMAPPVVSTPALLQFWARDENAFEARFESALKKVRLALIERSLPTRDIDSSSGPTFNLPSTA